MKKEKKENSYTCSRTQIAKTPFTFVEIEPENGIIVMGKYRMCNKQFKNALEAEFYIKDNIFEFVTILVAIITEELNKK